MYQNDDFTNKPHNLPTITRDETCYGAINPSQYTILSNNNHNNNITNKFLHPYLPLTHELTSLNPTHAPSPSNNNIQCSDNDQSLLKEDDEEQEIRRLKRMISNRESARRSRLRKRKQLENLQHQVCQLLSANHQLAEKLNQVMESNYQILQENAQLRQEAALLQKNVTDLLMSMKGSFEEGDHNNACNNNNNNGGIRIRASQTITSASITSTSMDVLQ